MKALLYFLLIAILLIRPGFADDTEWATYGNGLENHRFSPLTQINRENIADLELAWEYKTGIKASFQTSPIQVGKQLFISTPFNHVIALDAQTGKKIWRYKHPQSDKKSCCGPANRGVAVSQGKVFQATIDGHLIALDQTSGELIWDRKVGDLSLSMQESISALSDFDGLSNSALGDNAKITGGTSHSFNMAPQVYGNKVIIGSTGAGYGLHLDTDKGLRVVGLGDGRTGLRGFLAAFDIETGKELWRWYSVNGEHWVGQWRETTESGHNLNRDIAREKSQQQRFRQSWKLGGGSIWTTPAIDPKTGWLFLGTGNPAPNMDDSARPGDNLHTSSIVALDSRTGALKWAFQQVPHDRWGYDVSSPPVLFETEVAGKKVKAVGQAGKTGWFYVLNRATGKLLFKSEAFVPQHNLFADLTEAGVTIAPGIAGGSNWSPVALNATKKQAYVAGIHLPATYFRKPLSGDKNLPWQTYTYFEFDETDKHGTLSAISLENGQINWQQKTRLPLLGGVLATAGGLVFSGEGDGEFFALDEDTGQKLWSYKQPAGVNAPAISYSIDGKQYIAVAAGGNKIAGYPTGDSLLVFALPDG
ncbi:PQQ-binding-like beta-propeller repeat protein [Neptuniibacter sp.]|uniref:pyrroloquinoline quinone-dependent dehydrogenase n=1 Tax=Neptuniibacter sp. TaxID=1962643 RepID=UPI0026047BB5|nr:PQQ-binding-like beta-propeller repeat protein [Neptuniibacter sp.]MCP4595231.1 PQQ-binding-like beta-propeller repeat protein [Neptuniibacter sp.]